jgi:sortase A
VAPVASPASSRRRRRLRHASTVLMAAGALVLADGVATLVWQEPLTALQTGVRQHALRQDLRRLQAAGPTPLEARELADLRDSGRRIAVLARSLQARAADGAAIGRLEIPRLGSDMVIVKGSAPADLRKGPGTYSQAGLPGVPGTAAIAGHRTTYLAPFRHIDRLRRGDPIVVAMPYATFTYRVEGTRIVAPDALWILRRARYDRLVLSACHPLFSAARRIVVFARLARVLPLGAARAGQGMEKAPATLTPVPS